MRTKGNKRRKEKLEKDENNERNVKGGRLEQGDRGKGDRNAQKCDGGRNIL